MESTPGDNLPVNPRENASFLSNMFFCFTVPIFKKGRKTKLEAKDLYQALREHRSGCLGDKLAEAWQKRINTNKINSGDGMLLVRAILDVFGREIFYLGLTVFSLEFCVKITQPLFLGSLVAFYSRVGGNVSEAYLYAGAVVMCSGINVLLFHSYMLRQRHCGMKLRVSLISMIYRKALKLSPTALANTTVGQIVNLLSNDVGKMDLATIFLHYLWLGPLETIVITFFMYKQIGPAAIVGVSFLALLIPLQAYLGKKTSVIREKVAMRTDQRIRFMNEIIRGIQVIKVYAWEKPFGQLVAGIRKREIKMIRFGSYIAGIMISFMMFVTRFSVFSSLVVYALLGQLVTAEKAFVITAYCNILRSAMTDFFPKAISTLAETLVSFKRIQTYMFYSETRRLTEVTSITSIGTKLMSSEEKKTQADHKNDELLLKLKDVRAKWDAKMVENTLTGVSFDGYPGQLIAIIGPVGAGKSSIFQAILGELPTESGYIKVDGSISYASQEPWLFGGTIKQNILFGQPLDEDRYNLVIEKCALERDLILMPDADQTIVDDRGASLSGGQKARISLARAVYRQSSIYLLDDPLSAVDANVGRHLFKECIRTFLESSLVLLVTHQLQYLEAADKIIVMDHGRIIEMGTYNELKSSNVDFARLLTSDKVYSEVEEKSAHDNNKVRRMKTPIANEKLGNPESRLLVKETQKTGTIDWRLYVKYLRSGAGGVVFTLLLSLCITAQLLASMSDYFLAYWVNKANEANDDLSKDDYEPANMTRTISVSSTNIHQNRDSFDILIFTILILATVIVTLSRSFLFFNVAMKASKSLHNAMYQGVVHASMLFFHTNPVGRILNRFSKDMGQVDEQLPAVMIDVIQGFLSLVGVVVVVSIVNLWFLIPTVLMIGLFYKLRNFYLLTARNVKRMEAVTRSPIFSHLSSSLSGLPTIRAFRAQNALIREFDRHQDMHSSVFFAFLATTRAFGFWLDCICVLYIAIVTLSFFLVTKESGGNVGLAITQALSMTGIVQWGMRQSAELENLMTAVERIVEYESIEKEDAKVEERQMPPEHWSRLGSIQFKKFSMKYFDDPDAEYVLKDLNFEIMPNEKIGVVGRTGAGKSSLINALFRLAFNEGAIIIDGIDSKLIELNSLRSKISIIPQEPVLFSGSIRYNLDPFDEFPDTAIWEALDEVKLKKVVSDFSDGLQSKVAEGGSNFSIGQRQLICLARALLRKNRILILDEATANVDPLTDALIQSTIRHKFKDCTVITIAHRLHTVMDSDMMLVMDAGRVVEYDEPYVLLTESESNALLALAREAGQSTFNSLLGIAKTAYESNRKIR